jgi:hypothetical protein
VEAKHESAPDVKSEANYQETGWLLGCSRNAIPKKSWGPRLVARRLSTFGHYKYTQEMNRIKFEVTGKVTGHPTCKVSIDS